MADDDDLTLALERARIVLGTSSDEETVLAALHEVVLRHRYRSMLSGSDETPPAARGTAPTA